MPALDPLAVLLDLQPAGEDAFTAPTHGADSGVQRVYGGHVAAQAVVAAARTVQPGREVHSLHCSFLRSGRPGVPVHLTVARPRDGQAFSTRHVTVRQRETVVFEGTVSFHVGEPGDDWTATPMPDVPPAEAVAPVATVLTTLPTLSVFEQRLVAELAPDRGPLDPSHPVWVRVVGPLPDVPGAARAAIASMSDLGAVRATMGPGFRPAAYGTFTGASLDHGVWFHREPAVDGWILVDMEPLSNHAGRGLAIGRAWNADGAHVATWVQESLLRRH